MLRRLGDFLQIAGSHCLMHRHVGKDATPRGKPAALTPSIAIVVDPNDESVLDVHLRLRASGGSMLRTRRHEATPNVSCDHTAEISAYLPLADVIRNCQSQRSAWYTSVGNTS